MVLHHRDDDFVTRLQHRAEGMGHQIDGRGGAVGEDDFIRAFGVHEPSHLRPGNLVVFGRHLAEMVGAPVYVGVLALVGPGHGVDDRPRFLGAGSAIQEYQRFAVDLQRQGRKVAADRLDVEGVGAGRFGKVHDVGHPSSVSCAWASQLPTASRSSGSMGSPSTPSITSPRNASTSMPRACASGIPRARR